jgi:uncharacterized membrane protein YphA (DoxX/SURF4 family)
MNFDALAAAWAPRLLSILRIMAGLLLMQHGTAKHLKFPFVQTMANVPTTSLPGLAGILELRPVHAPDGLHPVGLVEPRRSIAKEVGLNGLTA